MPFVSYRARLIQHPLRSAGAIKVPPSLQTDLKLLQAFIFSRLNALDVGRPVVYHNAALGLISHSILSTLQESDLAVDTLVNFTANLKIPLCVAAHRRTHTHNSSPRESGCKHRE
jgi:hypothetical protein